MMHPSQVSAMSNPEQKANNMAVAWQRRLAGASIPVIALELGIGQTEVDALLRDARLQYVAASHESVAEERREVLGRLDAMLSAMWSKASEGDAKAVTTALAIEERRSKLLGLDAPVKSATDLTSGGEALKFTVTIPRVRRVDGEE